MDIVAYARKMVENKAPADYYDWHTGYIYHTQYWAQKTIETGHEPAQILVTNNGDLIGAVNVD